MTSVKMKLNSIKRTVTLVCGWLGGLAVLGPIASPIDAQTKFLVRDTLPDFSRYRTVYDCLAAAERLWWSHTRIALQAPGVMDTMQALKVRNPIPASVVAETKTCSEKFNVDSINVSQYKDWVKLFLLANRDRDADITARRRLAQTSSATDDSSNTQATVLLELLSVYGKIQPFRMERIQELVTQVVALNPAPSRLKLLDAYGVQFTMARHIHDSITAKQAAQKYIAIAGELTDNETSTENFTEEKREVVMEALEYINRSEVFDSLRKSAAAYVAIKKQHWEYARKNTYGNLPKFLGEKAPNLTGDFWFSPDAGLPGADQPSLQSPSDVIHISDSPVAPIAPLTRPSPGKVSLVVFLYGGCRREGWGDRPGGRPVRSGNCWGTYAAIRRLVEAYPALEVTVVSQTAGYVARSRPLTPKEEAQVLRSWWLGFHRLPATLVISNTSSYRLEGVDRRIIDLPTENEEGYLFGRNNLIANQFAYLVDVDGLIVNADILGREERRFRELLDVIMNRGR